MSQGISQLLQVLNYYETPTFLLSKEKSKYIVKGHNTEIEPFLESESGCKCPVELKVFFSRFKSFYDNFSDEFTSKFEANRDSINSKFKEGFSIQNQHIQVDVMLERLKSSGHGLYLIHLDVKEVESISGKKPHDLKLYQKVFKSLPIGIAANLISDSSTVFANDEMEEIYGWNPEELQDVSEFFRKVYPDETYRKEISEMILKDIASGDPKKMNWKNLTITTKSGKEKIVNAKNIPLYEENLMVSTIVDLTETYKAQLDLKTANERLDKALKATSDAIWEWNLSEDELFWGDGYERLFGYAFEDNKVSKAFWESKIHPSDSESFFESLDQALKDQNLYKWTFVYRFLNSEGNYANVRENIIIVRDEKGNPIRLVGALQDITRALKRETHLDLLEKLVDGTKDSILVTKVKSNSFLDSEIVYANSSFQSLFGFDIPKVIGKSPREFYLTSKNKSQFHDLEAELSEWEAVDINVLSLKKDNVEFWNNLSITPILDDQGWYTHWMIVNRDVNERKTNEEKKELLSFTHQAFQSDESLENLLCKISLKIEDLVRTFTCQFWIVDQYSKELSKFIELREGKFIDTERSTQKFNSEDFVRQILSAKKSKFQLHADESEEVKLSFGFEIKSHGEPIGVMILGFKDTYSREETLRLIFDEFSIQLANEISRKRAENEMKLFFENSPDFLCIAGKDGFLKKTNKRASEILGYSQQEFLEIPFLNFIVEEDWELTMEMILKARETKEYYNREIRIISKDSKILFVDWTIFSFDGSDDIFCTGKNVTAYKNALEDLNTQIEKFQILSETVSDAVWDMDIQNNKVIWGRGLKRLFGYEVDEFGDSEEAWLEKIYPDDRNRVETTLNVLLKDQKINSFREEYRLKTKKGDYVDVLDRGTVIRNDKGEAIRMVGSLQDISAFRNYQAKLEEMNRELVKQTNSLSRSNKDLEEFAYIASHDLQEPLRMVTVFLTRLEEKYDEELDDKAREYIKFAVDGAKRMRLIIQSLLNFSKVGGENVIYSSVNLESVIEDVKLLLSEMIKDKNAKIEIDKLPEINSVENELKEVFLNLIDNALKYSKKNQKPKIKISYKENEQFHILSVEDNGIGISEEYFDKIFGIFQRLHSQSEYSGTGIGLAIVKKITNNLGGYIKLSSKLNTGSTFKIFLPKKPI